jgi:hypothetical protein
MFMNSTSDSWKHIIMRAVIVTGMGIVLGAALYQFAVFTPSMKAFQFSMSSLSIGIMYAALKSRRLRDGLAALLVWYVILTGLMEEFNSWLLFLNLAYIGGMAGAVVLHQRAVRSPFVHGAVLRIVLAGATVGVVNGVVVIVLAVLIWNSALAHISSIMAAVYFNLQIGSLIGLATGSGMELAEYLIGKFPDRPGEVLPEPTARVSPAADTGTT